MALPTNADVVVVQGYWWDEITQQGVANASVSFKPVPLGSAVSATKTPNLRDLGASGYVKTRARVASVDPETGYFATLMVASNDPDLDAYGGREVVFTSGSTAEPPFVVEVPYNASTTTVNATMADATGLDQGATVRVVWLADAALLTTPTPAPSVNYLTSTQTLATIADGIEAHEEDGGAHPEMQAALLAGVSETARDAIGAALVAGANITITPNDGADTITIAASVPAEYTDEQAQDTFAALIAAGTHSGISFFYNDASNTLSATVAAQSWSQITGKPTFATVATSGDAADLTGTLADGVIPSGIARDSEVTSAVSAASTTDRARANHTGSQASTTISDFTEAVQDAVGALLGAGSNITLNYDDAGNTLTVTGVGDGTGLDAEAVRDAIGVALVGVGNIAVTVNDGLDTITISTTATVNSTDATLLARANHTGTQATSTITGFDEQVRDVMGTALVAGTNITITPNDAGDTITVASAGAAAEHYLNPYAAPYSLVLGTSDSGSIAANDAALTQLLADMRSTGKPALFSGGTIHITGGSTTGLVLDESDMALVGIGEGTHFVAHGTNQPILTVGPSSGSVARVHVSGLRLEYNALATSGHTASAGLKLQNVWMSTFERLEVTNAYDGVTQVDGSFVFSCSFRDIKVKPFIHDGFALYTPSGANTGNVIENLYLSGGDDAAQQTITGRAFTMAETTESFIGQVNMEWIRSPREFMYLEQCQGATFAGIHAEGLFFTGNGKGVVRLYGSNAKITGLTVYDLHASTALGSGTSTAIFALGTNGVADVDTLRLENPPDGSFVVTTHSLAINDGTTRDAQLSVGGLALGNDHGLTILDNVTLDTTVSGSVVRPAVVRVGGVKPDGAAVHTLGDADITISPRMHGRFLRATSALTAARSVTLGRNLSTAGNYSTVRAPAGVDFTVTRTTAATGAFNLLVKNYEGTTIATLATAGAWARLAFNGSDWTQVESGYLAGSAPAVSASDITTGTLPDGVIPSGIARDSEVTSAVAAKQDVDSDLTTIAGLTATSDNFLQAKSSAWASRTPAQVVADLAGTSSTTLAVGNDGRFTQVTANTQTASYTLVLADAGKAVEMNVASGNTLTIPPNSSVAFPVGTVLEVLQYGAGQTTVTAGAGVTLRAPDGAKTAKQYASASLRQRATDEWVLAGSVTT